jgi:hypothetical protein
MSTLIGALLVMAITETIIYLGSQYEGRKEEKRFSEMGRKWNE